MTQKNDEVAFLADEFDLSAKRAAGLIAETPEEQAALTAAQLEHERQRDPYGDAPIPKSPEDAEVPGNGGMQKTVLKHENNASRTGP